MKTYTTKSKIKGSAIGTAFVVKHIDRPTSSQRTSFDVAMSEVSKELAALGDSNDSIFAAHLEMLSDPLIADTVNAHKEDGADDAEACRLACSEICQMFESIDDEYLRTRAEDVKDIFGRLLQVIEGREASDFDNLPSDAIIIAEELTPSDTSRMDLSRVRAFITKGGSSTSHVCIIAATRGIAVAVGVSDCMDIRNGANIIVDSKNAAIIEDAPESVFEDLKARIEKENSTRQQYAYPPERIMANAGSCEDVERAIGNGAAGIGLFRSEFVFMDSDSLPSEEEQYSVYARAVTACGEKPLTIRTLDIGADKALPYLRLPKEENPNLGIRGIRFCLKERDIFKTQIRAILRAGAKGNVRMMIPMISLLRELEEAKMIITECKSELKSEGNSFDAEMKLGIMIETPSAVLLADKLANECDFFSIGTNDLTQYIMAADRGNSECASYCDYTSTSVLKAIAMTASAARAAGIECCMCGEMASDSAMSAELVELGVDTISISYKQ